MGLRALVLSLFVVPAALAQADPAAVGSWQTRTVDLKVPQANGKPSQLRVILPAQRKGGPRPVVLFYHGLWVGPGAYLRYVEPLATRGYAVALFDQLERDSTDLPAWARAGSAALDQLAEANQDKRSGLKGELDLARVGVMGHSFGGMGTIALAATDARVKAAVALAPGAMAPDQLARYASEIPEDVPLLVVTAQLDTTSVPRTFGRPAWEAAKARNKLYVEVAKADHATNSDLPSLGAGA